MKNMLLPKFLLLGLFIIFETVLFGQGNVLNISASDIKYDAKRDRIYAIVHSYDPIYGNSIVRINPYSGIVEYSFFVGSEPICMALTKDSNYIWIGFDGESFVKRFNLITYQVDRVVGLGTYNGNAALYAESIATLDLSSELVVVSRKRKNVSPRHSGVIAIFNSTILPGVTPGHTGSNIIAAANDTNMVFGINTESTEAGFRVMSIDTIMGISLLSTTKWFGLGNGIKYYDGKVFSVMGKVVQPFFSTPVIIGTYPNISYNNVFDVDLLNNKVFFAEATGYSLLLKRYNYNTYTNISNVSLQNIVPITFQGSKLLDLIRYGERGLGFILSNNDFFYPERKIVLIETCFVKMATDLSIQTSLNPQLIAIGDTVALKYVVANSGIISADSVVVKDTLNSAFEVLSYSVSSGNANIDSNIVSWKLDSLNSGASDTLIVMLHLLQTGQFSNTVNVNTASLDCDLTNNTTTYFINVFNVPTDLIVENNNLFRVYPNPFSDKITLDLSMFPSSESINVYVVSNIGQHVFNKTLNPDVMNSNYVLDLSHLNDGVYNLIVSTETKVKSMKIVKIK